MNVRELIDVLAAIDPDMEVRIGDQIESGPYSHTSVGGIWRGAKGAVIVCGNPDDEWVNESTDEALPGIWPIT